MQYDLKSKILLEVGGLYYNEARMMYILMIKGLAGYTLGRSITT